MTENAHFLHYIALEVFNQPLMILPAKLDLITRVLGERIGVEGAEVKAEEMAKARGPVSSGRVEIAVIPIIGSLVHRASGLDAVSGMRSYRNIRNDFRDALSDSKVDAILLDIDSPGGAVAGVFDLADEIYEANAQKPVYAYANESAYSAAYLLGSSATKLFLPRTGGVGSIGVRMAHVDQSELDKKVGVKVTNLFVGERKVDFDPHSPLSEEAYNTAIGELKEIYELFTGAVARNRAIPVESVKATEAGLYMGQHAVDIGLADEVMTFDEAIAFIVDDVATQKKTNGTRTGARKGSRTKKEVKHTMFNTLAEFKAECPDLYKEFAAEVQAEAERDLRASFEAKEQGLEAQISELKGEIKAQGKTILELKEENLIRSVQEQKRENEREAEVIWTKALSASDIPEGLHSEIRQMVRAQDYVAKEGALNREEFQAAVDAKIAKWEGKGMKTSVLGSGFNGHKEPDAEAAEIEQEAKDDDKWVDKMLALGGQVEEGGEE